MDAVNDSADTVKQRTGMSDGTYDTFAGRVGANLLSGAGRIGDGVTGGLASKIGEGIVRLENGQNFFEPSTPTIPVAQPAAPAAPAAVPTTSPTAQQPGVQLVAASAPEARTLADAVNKRTYMPPNGGGVMVNNSTGAVTKFNPPQPAQPGAPAEPKEESIHSLAERFGNARTLGDMLSAKAELRHRLAMDPAMAGKALGMRQLQNTQAEEAYKARDSQVGDWAEHSTHGKTGDEGKNASSESVGNARAAVNEAPMQSSKYPGASFDQIYANDRAEARALIEKAHKAWRISRVVNKENGGSLTGRQSASMPHVVDVKSVSGEDVLHGVPLWDATKAKINPFSKGNVLILSDGRRVTADSFNNDRDLLDELVQQTKEAGVNKSGPIAGRH